MLRGYRLLVAALVGLVFVGTGSTVTYQLYDASQQRQTNYHYQPASQPSLNKPTRGHPVAKGYQPYCQNPQTNENADLCAQWAAVDQVAEANRMSSLNLRFAIASLWATIIATALLLWTLFETRETSRRELRAYLFVDASNIFIGIKPHNKGRVISVVAVKNSGSTPAHRVAHWSFVKIADHTDEAEMSAPKSLEDAHQSTIPPGGVITADRITNTIPTRTEIAAIKKGLAVIYVYGSIEYVDVFGRSLRTDYRLNYTGLWPLPESALLRFCAEGNDAT